MIEHLPIHITVLDGHGRVLPAREELQLQLVIVAGDLAVDGLAQGPGGAGARDKVRFGVEILCNERHDVAGGDERRPWVLLRQHPCKKKRQHH